MLSNQRLLLTRLAKVLALIGMMFVVYMFLASM